jgi:hypothetical protein
MKASSHGKWYWRPDYLGWSIACGLAWGVIWILVATLASMNTVHSLGKVFLGWVIGWFMATFARVVYPAPRRTLLTWDRRDRASKS